MERKKCTGCRVERDISFFLSRNKKTIVKNCSKCRDRSRKYKIKAGIMTGKGSKTKESLEIDGVLHRKCSDCKKMVPAEKFGKNKHLKDGLHSRCLKCQKKRYENMTEEQKDKMKSTKRNIIRKMQRKLEKK